MTTVSPSDHSSAAALPPLDVSQTFDGKNILLIGTTGFVGKVALSMLLRHYPDVGRVYCLVRPGAGNTADERFFEKVAASRGVRPGARGVRRRLPRFLREKIVADPRRHRPAAVQLRRRPVRALRRARRPRRHHQLRRPGLVHAVARERAAHQRARRQERPRGRPTRSARAWSTSRPATSPDAATATSGRTRPWSATSRATATSTTRDFAAEAEIEDCQRIIEQVREQANDRVHIARFRERAAESLREQRRDPDDENTLKLAIARERKIWIDERLTRARHGARRALGLDQHVHLHQVAGRADHPRPTRRARRRSCARRSSSRRFRYPFPGWNEGFNTTAPLVYLVLKGQRQIVAGHRHRARRHPGRHGRGRHASRPRPPCSSVATRPSISSAPAT